MLQIFALLLQILHSCYRFLHSCLELIALKLTNDSRVSFLYILLCLLYFFCRNTDKCPYFLFKTFCILFPLYRNYYFLTFLYNMFFLIFIPYWDMIWGTLNLKLQSSNSYFRCTRCTLLNKARVREITRRKAKTGQV